MTAPVRYRFAGFVVSPRRRTLARDGAEIALIPRYFDLLLLLLERREDAVSRTEIFDRVWRDVIVSDGALTQAVRALRVALGDDSRDPRFIRTVSRHGYRFVFVEVVLEPDEGPASNHATGGPAPVDAPAATVSGAAMPAESETLDGWMERLLASDLDDDERREAAERLHALGTAKALAALSRRGHQPAARALLRDARWDVPRADAVPVLGGPDPVATAIALVTLRVRRTWRLAASRWWAAVSGAAVAGTIAGAAGGALLTVLPGAAATATAVPILAVVGAVSAVVGAAGVAAGLALAETAARSWRGLALTAAASLGGLVAGGLTGALTRATLASLFGLDLPEIGGALDGAVLGGAVGVGYAVATSGTPGGAMAAPDLRGRWRIAAAAGLAAAIGGLVLGGCGRALVAGSLHAVAEASRAPELRLSALARAIGEPEFGRLTGSLIAAAQGAVFGAGTAFGFSRKPARS